MKFLYFIIAIIVIAFIIAVIIQICEFFIDVFESKQTKDINLTRDDFDSEEEYLKCFPWKREYIVLDDADDKTNECDDYNNDDGYNSSSYYNDDDEEEDDDDYYDPTYSRDAAYSNYCDEVDYGICDPDDGFDYEDDPSDSNNWW